MKNVEIERKFKISKNKMPDVSKMDFLDIEQGYLKSGNENMIRLRKSYEIFHLGKLGNRKIETFYNETVKKYGLIERPEFEINLEATAFKTLWPAFEEITLEKKRYRISINGVIVELDIFGGELEGLIIAEVEFDNMEDCNNFKPLDWFGKEVSKTKEYHNYFLALDGLPSGWNAVKKEKSVEYFEFVSRLVENYDCASWKTFSEDGSTEEDVKVFQRGVKGPPDWFSFENGLFRHRGYTAYKEKYNYSQFENLVKRINTANQKWRD